MGGAKRTPFLFESLHTVLLKKKKIFFVLKNYDLKGSNGLEK